VFPPGTPSCPNCSEDREHLDVGSSWVVPEEAGGGFGVIKTLTIPSADLFHTVVEIPPGFPVNIVVDLFFIRDALESISDSGFQW
jgi:hypothetical protein